MNELILNMLQNVGMNVTVQIIVALVLVLGRKAWKAIRLDRGRHSTRGRRIISRRRGRHAKR